MLTAVLFERAIAWAAAEPRAAELDGFRADFERRTGPIVSGSEDFESRIAHFFELALCAPLAVDRPPLIARFAAANELSAGERLELAGWLRSYRSLWTFDSLRADVGQVHDRIGRSRFRVTLTRSDRQLRPGDCFDGRLIAIGSELFLSPGRVFHPRVAMEPLQAMLSEALARGMLDATLLDPLLGMRSRLRGFESIRAEHVYRLDALDAQGLAAPWARPDRRSPTTSEHT